MSAIDQGIVVIAVSNVTASDRKETLARSQILVAKQGRLRKNTTGDKKGEKNELFSNYSPENDTSGQSSDPALLS